MLPPRAPTKIECLACGETRIVYGLGRGDTGECPRCRYVGWGFSEELDSLTRSQIMNGAFAGRSADRSRDIETPPGGPRRPATR
jgi:hypothetical protein